MSEQKKNKLILTENLVLIHNWVSKSSLMIRFDIKWIAILLFKLRNGIEFRLHLEIYFLDNIINNYIN